MSRSQERNDAAREWVQGELIRRGYIKKCPKHEENLIDREMLPAEDLLEEFEGVELPEEIADQKELLDVLGEVLGDAAEECGACGAR